MDYGSIQIAVVDKYLILNLDRQNSLLPDGGVAEELGLVLAYYSQFYDIICDFRSVRITAWTEDLRDFVSALAIRNCKVTILVDKTDMDSIFYTKANLKSFFRTHSNPNIKFRIVRNAIIPFPYFDVKTDLLNTYSSYDFGVNKSPYSNEEIKFTEFMWPERFADHQKGFGKEFGLQYVVESVATRALTFKRNLENQITQNQRASPLLEFAFNPFGKDIQIIPYQSYSLHNLDTKDGLLLSKPALLASRTNSILRNQYEEFLYLINNRGVKETEITKFIERNPQFLMTLGYKEIYPQVILEKEDGKSLIPDFILKPITDDWCSILDFKLPKEKIIVGLDNRKQFASQVHALSAQLREYAAYFDDRKLARRVEQKYGIRCYKPKMIGVIGKRIDSQNDDEVRRLMTVDPRLEIITYDRLEKAAHSRLLI